MPLEADDPVIASYNVYISPPTGSDSSRAAPKLYVLQYPSHRHNSKPYNTSRSQKPSSFRQKPNTGIVEVDVPILTSDNYNQPLGDQFGKAMHESKLNHPNSSYGLSGGFSQHQPTNTVPSLSDIPQHGFTDTALRTQTLGGKISQSTDKDPIYMLATLHANSREVHLQHLDAVVQLRPQLHHIDAADEMKKRAETAVSRAKTGADPSAPAKLETKAIEMKIKDTSKEDPRDRNPNQDPKRLRDIQNEPWSTYEWIEKTPHDSKDRDTLMGLHPPQSSASLFGITSSNPNANSTPSRRPLKSALDNDEWLNRMSSPGIELRTRLKGRDRERARRKRQERARATRVETAPGAAGAGEESSATDDEEEDEDEEQDQSGAEGESNVHPQGQGQGITVVDRTGTGNDEVHIKQESAGGGGGSIPVSTAAAVASAAKKRGQPLRNKS